LASLELASAARILGEPAVGVAALRELLADNDTPPATRASALVQVVGCVAQQGWQLELDAALVSADALYSKDSEVDDETTRVQRAQLRVVTSERCRRVGRHEQALRAVSEGLELLGGAHEAVAGGGYVGTLLVREQILNYLSVGQPVRARAAATGVLNQGVRATAATARGWIDYALATRVFLPAGDIARAQSHIQDAVRAARKFELHGLLAESLTTLSELQEQAGDALGALSSVREAGVARQERVRQRSAARSIVLGKFIDKPNVLGVAALEVAPRELAQWTTAATALPPATKRPAAGKERNTEMTIEIPAIPAAPAEKVPAEKVPVEKPLRRRRRTPEPEPVDLNETTLVDGLKLPTLNAQDIPASRKHARPDTIVGLVPVPDKKSAPDDKPVPDNKIELDGQPVSESHVPESLAPESSGRRRSSVDNSGRHGSEVPPPSRAKVATVRKSRHAAPTGVGLTPVTPQPVEPISPPQTDSVAKEAMQERLVSTSELGFADLLAQALLAYKDGDSNSQDSVVYPVETFETSRLHSRVGRRRRATRAKEDEDAER
jgi:hypothetical protein